MKGLLITNLEINAPEYLPNLYYEGIWYNDNGIPMITVKVNAIKPIGKSTLEYLKNTMRSRTAV